VGRLGGFRESNVSNCRSLIGKTVPFLLKLSDSLGRHAERGARAPSKNGARQSAPAKTKQYVKSLHSDQRQEKRKPGGSRSCTRKKKGRRWLSKAARSANEAERGENLHELKKNLGLEGTGLKCGKKKTYGEDRGEG